MALNESNSAHFKVPNAIVSGVYELGCVMVWMSGSASRVSLTDASYHALTKPPTRTSLA